MLFLVVIILGIGIPIILGTVEIHRKHHIKRVKEHHDIHKLEALERYIVRYTEEGHSLNQIESWLINYGYPSELVKHAIAGAHNVRATVPN